MFSNRQLLPLPLARLSIGRFSIRPRAGRVMDYNTAIVLFGLFSTGLLLGGFGALVSLKGENLTADVAGHGVVSGVVISQGVVVWLGMLWLSVPLLWALGFATSALTLGFIFWARGRGFSPGAAQALAISFAYGSTLVLLSLVQGSGAFSTKGLTTLLLGDAATLTLSRVLPALGVLLLAASGFVLLRRPLLNWVLDQESVALQGNKRRLEALWVVATVVVVLTCLPALGLTLLVGGDDLASFDCSPMDHGIYQSGRWLGLDRRRIRDLGRLVERRCAALANRRAGDCQPGSWLGGKPCGGAAASDCEGAPC
jgi:ABC-type Mn2+/Zn2+ transport system permease subunit